MENDDETTMTPVEQSNASASLPGGSGPAAASAAGGAMAASGLQDSASTAAPAPAPTSLPYATATTPTAIGVPTPRLRPFSGPAPRLREDVVESPAFGARGASEIQWTAQSNLTQQQEEAIRTEAGLLGIAPSTLASVVAYETIGTFDTDIQGGTGGNYRGLIQFGPTERRMYGYRDGMTFEEQLAGPVHNYLVDRGVKPGHGIAEVYSIINAGSLKNGVPGWGASDRPGWTVRRHVDEITATRLPGFRYLDEGWTPPGAATAADVPDPRLRPASDDPALGAAGARSMPEDPAAMAYPAALAATVNDDGRVVERGSKGDAVREWQQFLSENGYTDAAGRPLTVDGDFGRRTREATKMFQEASQIGVDGRVGPETLSAALFVIDPGAAPMPGQIAYEDGARTTKAIIAPAEVDMPLPRPRPERGEGVPNPRLDPRRQPPPAEWTDVDAMTEVDENGNLVRRLPTEGLASEPGKMTETERAQIYAKLERFRREEAAQRAGEKATRQRLREARTKDDRFRPAPRPRDTRGQDEIMLIRSAEATREFARGMGDQYRREIDRKRYAPMGGGQNPAMTPEETIERVEKQIDDALLRVNPTPAEVVTEVNSFGPQAGGINTMILRSMSRGYTPAGRRNAVRDLRRRMQEAGVAGAES